MSSNSPTRPVYTLVAATDWRAAQASGEYRGGADDLRDGFLHFSTAQQLRESAARHRAGAPDLMLVTVETGALGPLLRWEPAKGGGRVGLFPHLYGPLPMSAVRSAEPLPLDPAGRHVFPAAIP